MSTATETQKATEYHCSCGRTFAHEISLKRHCWVTGHTAVEAEAAAPAAAAVVEEPAPLSAVVPEIQLPGVGEAEALTEALRILREKQMQQEAFEARQERERQLRLVVDHATALVNQQVQRAAETSRRGFEVFRQSTLLALRMLLVLLVCGGLLLTGMGLGRLLSSPAEAATPGVPAAVAQNVGQ